MPALHSPPGSWSGRLATRRAATCSSARTTPVSIPRRVMASAASAFLSASEQLAEAGAMERGLELDRRGWGRVAPNPLVGAVVLQGGKVVGEGYHAEFGGPHAEVVALEAAGGGARGATLVVNLEPCAHHGKTPPCTDAIVAAGIGRVVAAIRDPDLLARGGAGVLRSHSVVVSLGLLAEEAAALNAPFLFAREQAERPFVAVKLATSIAGRIADAAGCATRGSSRCCAKAAGRSARSSGRTAWSTGCTGCRRRCGSARAPFRRFPASRPRRSPPRRAGCRWSAAPWALIHYWYWTGGYVYRDRNGRGARQRRRAKRGERPGKRERGRGKRPPPHDPRAVQGLEAGREHRRERRLSHRGAGGEGGVHGPRRGDHDGPDAVGGVRDRPVVVSTAW